MEKKLEDLKLSPKLGFLLFSQGYIISFPLYFIGFQLETVSNI